ncbi:CHAT domain-containing protein [Nocardia fluminea]|uniref:CHAT domain-containing protein n=1 Tax=Nocardia fluminea TaxID=134984 RepID=UPI0036581059
MGNELIRALEERVRAFTENGDAAVVLDETALVQAQQLAALLRIPVEDSRPGHTEALTVLGWLYWYRHQALPRGHGGSDLDTCLALFSRLFAMTPELVPDQVTKRLTQINSLPDATAQARHQGIVLVNGYERSGNLDQLDAAIDLFQQVVDTTPGDHPNRAMHLANLGYTLQTRYERTGRSHDLDQAVTVGNLLVDALPTSHPARVAYLSDLGDLLRTRVEITEQPGDLDTAIDLLRDATESTPTGHPDRAAMLSNLGYTLLARRERTGQQIDLTEATERFRQAFDATRTERRDDSVSYRAGNTEQTEPDAQADTPSLETPRRFVNSRICQARTDIDVPRGLPLEQETGYEILINIGQADDRSLLSHAVFPDQHLPPGGLWLTVVAFAPEILEKPEERALFLPSRGDSFVCPCTPDSSDAPRHTCTPGQRLPHVRIPFTTPENRRALTVRLAIYYRAAVVHVHELALQVGEGSGPTGTVVYTLTQSFSDLGAFATRTLSVMTTASSGSADAQVYVNGVTIQPLAYTYNDAQAENACRQARETLFHIHLPADPPWTSLYQDQGKNQGDYETDLRSLARVGRDIYASFFRTDHQKIGGMLRHEASAGPAIVQIARPITERLAIPWQMIYDLPMQSDDPDLYRCPSLREFGPATEVVPDIPSMCPYLAEHPARQSILCPFGFWGLAHILEIPPHLGEQPNLPHIVHNNTDTPLATLVGWNTQLSPQPESRQESERHLQALRDSALGVLRPEIQSRKQLAEALSPSDMDLVYLYCHGDRRTPPGASVSNPLLVLGAGETFNPQDVSGWSELYGWPDPHWRGRQPLIILNACQSGAILEATLADFVGVFTQTVGAAGVIAAEVALEQRLAGHAMEIFLTQLTAGGVSVGEAMRHMRWALLKRGNLMGFAYSPYCAADLLLRPPSPPRTT